MFNIKLIFSNLARNRSRYLLFGLIMLLLSIAWLVCLFLGDAAAAIQQDLIDTYGKTVMLQDVTSERRIMVLEDYETFCDPNIVERMEPIAYTQADIWGKIAGEDEEGVLYEQWQQFSVIGMRFDTLYTPFTQQFGSYTLTRGRLVEADDECIIFDDIYDTLVYNGVIDGLGDTLILKNYTYDVDAIETGNLDDISKIYQMEMLAEYRLKVVGTIDRESTGVYAYQEVLSTAQGTGTVIRNRPYIIFTSYDHVMQYSGKYTESGAQVEMINGNPRYVLYSKYDIVYHLRDYSCIDEFRAVVQAYNDKEEEEKIQADYALFRKNGSTTPYDEYASSPNFRSSIPFYEVRFYLNGFENMLEPLEQIGAYTDMIGRNLTLMIGMMMIFLTVLNLYARVDEIGILRCVGMSRGRIACNLLIEQCMFLLFSLTLGTVVGAGLSAYMLGRVLKQNPIQTSALLKETLPVVAGQIYAVGLALCLLASLGAAIYIQRYRPLKILRNRS